MMDYKYTGQDWVCVQPSVHRGTHRARSSSAAELSVSTFLLGVKKKKESFPSVSGKLFIWADLSAIAECKHSSLSSCGCAPSTHSMR